MKMCDYGCGKEAKYPLKNGKWCCSVSWNSCPINREKLSKAQNRPESKTLTIEKIQEKYLIFTKEEEMRYNPDKPGEKEVQFHCKYNGCKNSKVNGRWFTPTYWQFARRRDALEHEDGNDGRYFYCSKKCKQECCLYRLISDPNRLKEYEKYNDKVYKETHKTIQKFPDEIKNIELRGRKYGYALDHKYSIYDGFINDVDPKIIGHRKNLECIPSLENSKKNKNSTITLNELLNEIR